MMALITSALWLIRSSGAGFTDSPERMNVALTRARHHLVCVGNKKALEGSVDSR